MRAEAPPPVRPQGRRRAPTEVLSPQPARAESRFPVAPLLMVAVLIAGGAAVFKLSSGQAPDSPPTETAAKPGALEAPLDNNDFYTTATPRAAPLAPPKPTPTPTSASTAAKPRPRPAAPAPPDTAAYVPPPAPAISFRPPEPAVAPSQPAPAPTPAPQPAPAAAPQAAAADSAYVVPVWVRRPSGAILAQLYPPSALDKGVGGHVVLDCAIRGSGDLACAVASETPAKYGFGRAALSASSAFKASPNAADGQSAVGKHVLVPINFKAAP
jgi:TonB family protein